MDNLNVNPRKTPFLEMTLKCCGYGYFEEYKKEMKDNFIKYLSDALEYSKELITLKIIFNGFDVDDDSLSRILNKIK
jgi:hypothetical protein